MGEKDELAMAPGERWEAGNWLGIGCGLMSNNVGKAEEALRRPVRRGGDKVWRGVVD